MSMTLANLAQQLGAELHEVGDPELEEEALGAGAVLCGDRDVGRGRARRELGPTLLHERLGSAPILKPAPKIDRAARVPVVSRYRVRTLW